MEKSPTQGVMGGRFATVLLVTFISSTASAVSFESGEVSGSWDTTLSYGQAWRTNGSDRSIIGRTADPLGASGAPLAGSAASITGSAFSENSDDGNQNYDDSLISNVLRFSSELELNYRNFGSFLRVSGFKDMHNDGDGGDRTGLSKAADRLVSKNVLIQDAYVWGQFEIGSMPAEIRVGEQVLSWGESTFIQNGINIINPFDVSKLRTPGSEVKDALVPVGMVSGSIAPSDNVTLEAFYQYDWERTTIEPPGSFFSTNDFVGDGGDRVMLGFGDVSDRGINFGGLLGAVNGAITAAGGITLGPGGAAGLVDDFNAVPRAPDIRPDQGGEFGVSMRLFVPDLNDTEIGFYAVNYHSRVPVISARTGTAASVTAATTVLGLLGGPGSATARAVATDQYARTARYLIEYPEDVQMYGVSFNTQLGASGIALQGEYSFKNDAPLQIDDIELLFAALCPIAGINPAIGLNQVDAGCGNTGTNQLINGFIERNISQLQFTATKVFGPVFKASTAVMVGEVGITHVHNMPSKSLLRLNGAGTFVSGNPFHAGATGLHAGKAAEGADHFADATSWGYRLAGRITYNNFIGPINMSPRFAWSHDVNGITPGPGGNFLEGRKAATLGVGLDYQNEWQADISYTNFFGAGRYNLLRDRDFVAVNLKYSF